MKRTLKWIGTFTLLMGLWAVAVQPDLVDFIQKNRNLENQVIAVEGTDLAFQYGTMALEDGTQAPFFEVIRNGKSLTGKRPASFELKLRHGDFDPLSGVPSVEDGFEGDADVHVYIVQFNTTPQEAYRQAITQLGGEVSWFIPNHANLVKMDAAVAAQIANLPYVRWVGQYHPAYRTEEFVLKYYDRAEEFYPLQTYNIMVHESGLGQKSAVAQKIASLGGIVDVLDAGKYLLRGTLTPEQLLAVLRYDEVLFVDRWGPYEKDMNNAREYGGANYVEVTPAPPGYTGQGVRGEVFDAGFNVAHIDFQSRPLIQHTTPGSDSHGAATSGIVFGDGTGNPDARGMLPDGQGIVANYSGYLGEPARYAFTEELLDAPYYAVFQTSSVGSPRTFFYTTISADHDATLFDFDILHCQSQSNAGNQDSRPEAWAKNIVSGGGVYHYNTLDPSDDCWCSGGSTGPGQDGRIKPDLCAYYDDILTTTTGSTTSYTTGFGGTSGATPIICGHMGLIFQMWSEGIFGNPTPGATVFENRCHMTTAKALAINTAQQYPFSGTGHDLTRVHQGWGFPDLQNLYDLRDKLVYVDETDLLAPLGMNGYTIEVSSGEPAFKATLVYADPPGDPAASMARINDLTLKVTSPSGVTYWGNHGLLEGNWSTPGGGPNVVDTVENVFVENPEAGIWSVQIYGDEIVEDSHVETPALDADYALVVTGGVQVPGFIMSMDPAERIVCTGEDAVYNLEFMPTMGFSQQVDLSVAGVPLGATATFGEDPVTPPATTTLTISSGAPPCMGDLDGDDDVDMDDLMLALAVWLEAHPTGDANDNGWVELMDLTWMMDHFGPCTDYVEDAQYNLTVTGAATAMNQIQQAILHLSATVADPPVLTAPANGAVEVSREPSFAWNAETEAVDYHLQLASDAGFTNIVHEATVDGTTYDLPMSLSSVTEYFWHVRSNNGCGEGAYSGVFSFTTIDQPDYMTEQFTSGVDLDGWTVNFIPNGAGDFYDHCGVAAAALPTDPAGGTVVALTDDGSATVTLTTPVSLYGVQYSTVYINANGNMTFTGPDSDYTESLADHFDTPRISGVFDDLGPHQGGEVSWKETADRLAITYFEVPELSQTNANTFQFELLYNGEVHVTWLQTDIQDCIAGLSEGLGLPGDFVPTDLSAAPPCTR